MPRPTVAWTRVPSASDYLVVWNGRGAGSSSLRLNAADVSCAQRADGVDECSLSWPDERPDLPPGAIFFLTVSARDGIAEPWHSSPETRVETQELAAAEKLEGRLRDLDSLGLAGSALDAARGGVLAEAGLYADAADAYRRALDLVPTPEVRVTLADIEMSMGLFRFAEPLYDQLLSEGKPTVHAAAAFGLGRLDYARGSYGDAARWFRQARELYAGLGLREEASAAHVAAERSEERAAPVGASG
jgi:tetratricopeptide (TPR) repeat protein